MTGKINSKIPFLCLQWQGIITRKQSSKRQTFILSYSGIDDVFHLREHHKLKRRKKEQSIKKLMTAMYKRLVPDKKEIDSLLVQT